MPTPLYVIKALAGIRESGATNMLDRDAVEMLVDDQRAAEWIGKASDSQYMDALNDMGAALSDDWMPEEIDPNYTLSGGYSYEDDDYDPDVTAKPDDRNFG